MGLVFYADKLTFEGCFNLSKIMTYVIIKEKGIDCTEG